MLPLCCHFLLVRRVVLDNQPLTCSVYLLSLLHLLPFFLRKKLYIYRNRTNSIVYESEFKRACFLSTKGTKINKGLAVWEIHIIKKLKRISLLFLLQYKPIQSKTNLQYVILQPKNTRCTNAKN